MQVICMWILQKHYRIKNRLKKSEKKINRASVPFAGVCYGPNSDFAFLRRWTSEIVMRGYIKPAFNFWFQQGISAAFRWIVCSLKDKSCIYLKQLQASSAHYLRACFLKRECPGLYKLLTLTLLWTWYNYLTFLSFSLLICKIT